jgi:hypothetical protein
MAHFLTLVLVKASEPEPARRAYELMAPYLDICTDRSQG